MKVFVIPGYPEQESAIIISYGEMDDRKYQKPVERIMRTENGTKEINLILQEVHSLADLLDIMSDTELYARDIELLINMLPLTIYAVLLAEYPSDDFLERESEQLLYIALQKRKTLLSAMENRQLEQAVMKTGPRR